MIQVDAQTMREVAPHFSGAMAERQNAIITAVGEVLATTLDGYAINTRLRIAHFLGQTCHESAGFRTTEEFASGEAYEGRRDLGNLQPGDGVRYKGRGLLQLTGRANYREVGELIGVKLEEQPERAAEPVLSLKIACEYWKRRNINALCDADDVVAVTRAVNGGTNGLDDRRLSTGRAKAAIARLEGFVLSGETPPSLGRPVLRRGSKGEAVGQLQRRLQQLGFMLAIDDDFGAGTEVAVAAFQRQRGLQPVDGIVGRDTWAALDAAASGG
ncbi:peptidoglycan-binding protein [Aquincola tertiaricarbonis]|uniref:Peptidoglycan-binding protein n=1 Tax=Aquincola tertiaricarbonis TaxID=391953 RepID=A0ABY4RZS1_AQUTE|nr:peptidoglycan-binding protein [Aquincola tertiaricarbonis]URI06466.1 peptidoglycan-binding protein [Aquincola tertiaricarbonis]